LELPGDAVQLLLYFAVIETREAPPGVVDPRRGCRGDAEQRRDTQPAPVPRERTVNCDTRCRDAETPPESPFEGLGPAHQGTTATWAKPAVSGRSNMRFMFCTAWPDAPLTRLSITESTTSVSERREVSGGRWTAIRQRVAARTERASG